ncbi:MAG: anaerobic glycerol-3-phosphate dehydrogenase subunit C [Halobacteriota archaeon]
MSDSEPTASDLTPVFSRAGDSESDHLDETGSDPLDWSERDLRSGADNCYKCTACDTSCPVAAVDDEFPGPKFQGPEQWRLTRKQDDDIDDSITSCSNCMRCDGACPSDVPLSQMHNTARAAFVDSEMSAFSREYVRNRLLSNYGRLARLGSKAPRLTNLVASNSVVRALTERMLGITSEREFPEFATETFREWWRSRGGSRVGSGGGEGPAEAKRIAYFHGCYTNHNTPAVGKALVRVFESFGYEVAVPDQRCSGTPMFANGMLEDAQRAAAVNVETLAALVDDGYDVVCSCTSCSMALRQEYPELFDFEGLDEVAANTYEALEYLRIHEDLADALAEASVDADAFAYHAPCHARNQGLDRQTIEVFGLLDRVTIEDVGDSCSGISGTYGWKTEKYDVSMRIGAEMFEHMERAAGTTGMTECPTCAMQMEHGTGYEVRHPLEVLEDALVD